MKVKTDPAAIEGGSGEWRLEKVLLSGSSACAGCQVFVGGIGEVGAAQRT